MLLDLIKIALCLVGYLAFAPVLALALTTYPRLRRWCLGALVLFTALPKGWSTLTIFSQDGYRGHVRGWECSLTDMVALGLIGWALLNGRAGGRSVVLILTALWGGYCLASLPGGLHALDLGYVGMAVFKYTKAVLPLLAVGLALRDREDLRALLAGMTAALLIELTIGLWHRYGQGHWRVMAWFEHPNPLAMWSYLLALPLLGAAMTPGEPRRATLAALTAVAGAGALVIMTLSRAALAAIVLGVGAVLVLRLLQRPSRQVAVGMVALALAGAAMLALSFDSIALRARLAGADTGVEDFREVLSRQSAEMLRDRPWTGIGWNNYGVANSRPLGEYSRVIEDWDQERGHRYDEDTYRANALVESWYWLHLAEGGWPSFVALLVFAAATVVTAAIVAWRRRREVAGGFAAGVMVALCLVYAHGQWERILVQTKPLATWMILVGAVAALASGAAGEPPRQGTARNGQPGSADLQSAGKPRAPARHLPCLAVPWPRRTGTGRLSTLS